MNENQNNEPGKTPQSMIQHWRFKPHNPGDKSQQYPRKRRHSSPALENFVHHWKYDPKAGSVSSLSSPSTASTSSPSIQSAASSTTSVPSATSVAPVQNIPINTGSAPGSRRVSPRARTSPYNTPRGVMKASESMEEIEQHFSLLMKPKMEPIAEDLEVSAALSRGEFHLVANGGPVTRSLSTGNSPIPGSSSITFPQLNLSKLNEPLTLPSLLSEPPTFSSSSVPKLPPLGHLAILPNQANQSQSNAYSPFPPFQSSVPELFSAKKSQKIDPSSNNRRVYSDPDARIGEENYFYHQPYSPNSPNGQNDAMMEVTSDGIQERMSIGKLVL